MTQGHPRESGRSVSRGIRAEDESGRTMVVVSFTHRASAATVQLF